MLKRPCPNAHPITGSSQKTRCLDWAPKPRETGLQRLLCGHLGPDRGHNPGLCLGCTWGIPSGLCASPGLCRRPHPVRQDGRAVGRDHTDFPGPAGCAREPEYGSSNPFLTFLESSFQSTPLPSP